MFDLDALDTGAIFSDCRKWRYILWRRWDRELPPCIFIGLNPSTADETTDDPTIRRCIGFARRWGYGSLYMLNIFAYRATEPADMKAADDPIGPRNDRWLEEAVRETLKAGGGAVAAWGAHGNFADRQKAVAALLSGFELQCLGTTRSGCPKHPLYLAQTTEREPWPPTIPSAFETEPIDPGFGP